MHKSDYDESSEYSGIWETVFYINIYNAPNGILLTTYH